MPGRRKNSMDIRELILQMRHYSSDRAVQRISGMHRQTVKRYRRWAAEQGLLAGPLPVEGAYLIGALSGYGIMASPAAADLLACHITGNQLPGYAAAFHPARYQDPAYLAQLAQWDATSGQL